MIIHPNNKNNARFKALDDKYDALIAEAEAKADSLRKSDDEPREKSSEAVEEWIKSGSEAWKEARREYFRLLIKKDEDRRKLIDEISREEFDKLNGDKTKILAHAKRQAKELIDNRKYVKNNASPGASNFIDFDSLLDPQRLIHDIKECIRLHYEFFKDDPQSIEELDKIILETVDNAAYIATKSKRPFELISITSKIAHETFSGKLKPGTGREVNVQKKEKAKNEPVITYIVISKNPDIKEQRVLTPFDREVHDAIVSLYVAGNKFITSSMIFETLTGKKGATLNPNQKKDILDSVDTLMTTPIIVDANAEAKLFNLDSFVYKGMLLPCEQAHASINGSVIDCIHLLREPPYYTYSSHRNQIGKIEVKLLNSPTNKNKETIMLQGYLYRRILAIPHLRPIIKYEDIYDLFNLSNFKSDASLKNKKFKIRTQTKKILEFWKNQNFIKGYSEKESTSRPTSITIEV